MYYTIFSLQQRSPNLSNLIRIANYNNIYCSNSQQLGKTIS